MRRGSTGDQILELGISLREALETGDIDTAVRLQSEHAMATAASSGYELDPTFAMSSERDLRLVASNTALRELEGLDENRHRELEVSLRLSLGLSGVGELGDLVAGVLIGLANVSWPRFDDERRIFRAQPSAPMWTKRLLSDEDGVPTRSQVSFASLSTDARSVLAISKLLRRRLSTSRRRLSERTLLPSSRLTDALTELEAAGHAARPTLADRLTIAGAPQLKALAGTVGVARSGRKESIVARLLDALSGEQLLSWLADTVPSATDEDLITIGLGESELDWLIDFSHLYAHYVLFVNYRLREAAEAEAVRSFARGWEVLPATDCCAICKGSPSRVDFSTPGSLPPFHIGCRCVVAVDVGS